MSIIALTVCVNYSDILQHGIKINAKSLKHWYIITSPEDKDTASLVEYVNLPNVSLLIYNDFFKDASINKGGAIRFGQQYIKNNYKNENNAILLLDADITFTGDILEKIPKTLEKNTLYGIKERRDYSNLKDYKNSQNGTFYVCSTHHVGFFQLYSQDTDIFYEESIDCGGCDNEFKFLFPNLKILDIRVKHLGKECVNWYGRKYEYGDYRHEGDLLSLAKQKC